MTVLQIIFAAISGISALCFLAFVTTKIEARTTLSQLAWQGGSRKEENDAIWSYESSRSKTAWSVIVLLASAALFTLSYYQGW